MCGEFLGSRSSNPAAYGNISRHQSIHDSVRSIPCRGMDETLNFTMRPPFVVAVFMGPDNSCSIGIDMKLGLGLYRHMLTRENFQFARQAGATHIVAHLVDYFQGGAHTPDD